jgi:hypothetical protein
LLFLKQDEEIKIGDYLLIHVGYASIRALSLVWRPIEGSRQSLALQCLSEL